MSKSDGSGAVFEHIDRITCAPAEYFVQILSADNGQIFGSFPAITFNYEEQPALYPLELRGLQRRVVK